VYHGSIVPARLPRTVIEALALTPIGVSLTIVGYETAGHHGYVNELTALATACGVASRVTFQPAVGRDELMRQCGRHDIGLALFPVDSDDVNERSMVGPSNKPFDYLARALPIVVTESREWRETFIDAGFGRECDPRSAKSIAAAWQWFLDHPDERAAMGERGRQRVLEEWNYDRMFRPVMARLLARSAEMSERAASANSIG
jgi:glycosyltransferase involved in cell wall biosynthesis